MIFRKKPWHTKWTPFALLELSRFRDKMRWKNLFDTEPIPHRPGTESELPPTEKNPPLFRLPDGSYTDAAAPRMGRRGTRFGRNVPLERTYPDETNLLRPNPRTVSRKLLTREEFIPATTLNLIAAAWIQFMQHGWFGHTDDRTRKPQQVKLRHPLEVPLEEGDEWPANHPPPEEGAWDENCQPEAFRPMRIFRTPVDPTRAPRAEDGPPTHINMMNHWWDASQLYGSSPEVQERLRAGQDGKLAIQDDDALVYNPDALCPDIPEVGFIDNWWLGLGLLYKLFIKEHNAVCDRLKRAYPSWSDDQLFRHAHLIVSALLAKIHTVEWTPGILGTTALDIAMNTNWYGLKNEKRFFYRVVLGSLIRAMGFFSEEKKRAFDEAYNGILGSEPDHHAAPYAMTEEFVSMYRMHPLVPDYFDILSLERDELLATKNLFEVSGNRTRSTLERTDLADLFYSFGVAHPGALRLHNYPRYLQNLRRDSGDRFDLGAVDIIRDRERGVPRYNEFRELMGMPRVRSFEELTDNPRWARELNEVYGGDLEMVDLMVGMFAEPLPAGFGFADTTFRVFILMASRRLKSDRFFTSDYRPEVYTPEGLEWIAQNTMHSVTLRHLPQLASVINKKNAFAPWRRRSP